MAVSSVAAECTIAADLTVDEATGVNVIGFRSGYGDGAYPSWFGLDENGRPLVLLTDFGILDARTF